MKRKIIDWLEQRTGLESAVKNFLYENIPASSGWRQVFGSIALFLFLVQAFTGILLAFNYAPTPGDAYNSLKYILTELTGGRLIRGLHHWGASMLIVVVVLHMVQVFLYGAYKRPREATWMVGVVLLLLTLTYGLTGYLLPWDNRAYWGTVVTTQIAAKAPLAGPYLARLLGGTGNVGVVTFARFYALHVLLLPPATLLLIGFHVYLVRKHGVAPMAGETAPPVKFFPEQVLKDTLAIFVAFVVLFVMAVAVKAPLESLADPTDTSYIPRPDWYFLFLFQTLKFFEGPLEVFGAVVLPGLAVLVLFLVPFIDRGKLVRLSRRTTAFGVVFLGTVGWASLTVAAILTTPKPTPPEAELASAAQDWQQLSPEELAGIGYFRKERCSSCHTVGNGGSGVGPDLANTAIRKSAAWMIEHFKRPSQLVPGTAMPPIQLSDSQLNTLAAFLLRLTPRNAKALASAPASAVEGALIYQASSCGTCHQVNGVGMKVGPPLNGLAQRRTRGWVEQHFLDPQKLSPGTVMPAYKFTPRDLERITTYLMALPR
jgi:ubiquinol-cytochrome c reductase cytochrome b subunit